MVITNITSAISNIYYIFYLFYLLHFIYILTLFLYFIYLSSCGKAPPPWPTSAALSSSPLQPYVQVPTWFLSPGPSPREHPPAGAAPPSSPGSDSGNSGPLVPPACTSLQFVTETFSLPSFLILSQQGFCTLHWIYNCIHGGCLSLRFGKYSAHFTHLQPLYSLVLPPSSPLWSPLRISLPTSTKRFYQLHYLRYPYCKLLDSTNTEATKTLDLGSPRLAQPSPSSSGFFSKCYPNHNHDPSTCFEALPRQLSGSPRCPLHRSPYLQEK